MDSYGFPAVPKHDRKLLGVLRRYVDNTVSLRVERTLSEQEWASLEACLFDASKIRYNSETRELKRPQWMPAIGSVRQTLEAIIDEPSSSSSSRRSKGSSPPSFNTPGLSRSKDNAYQASSPSDRSSAQVVRPRKDNRNAPSTVETKPPAPSVNLRQPSRPRAKRSLSAPLQVRFAQDTEEIPAASTSKRPSKTPSPEEDASPSQQSGPVAGVIDKLLNQASQLSHCAVSSSDSSDGAMLDSQTLSSSIAPNAPQIVSKIFQHYHHATAGILRQAAPLTSATVLPKPFTAATSQHKRRCSHPVQPPIRFSQSIRTG